MKILNHYYKKELIKNIKMIEILSLVAFSSLILLIEIYSETHLKNYGRFIERIVYLFSIKTLFNIFKFSILLSFLYVVSNLSYPELINFVNSKVLNFDTKYWLLYLVPSAFFSLIVILTNSKELFRQLEDYSIENERINKTLANLKYIFFRLISFVVTFFIFGVTLNYVTKLHAYFVCKNFTILDWLTYNRDGVDNYNKGVYFSLILTIIIFFLFNNSFIKKNSGEWEYRKIKFDFFNYFFITLILSLGLFFGFFSIFNGIYNLLNSGISSWISKENVLGILPIRISSLLIIIYLLTYIYKEVLDRTIFPFLVLGILPLRKIENYRGSINLEKRETLFFSQISFYILNIGIAEYFIIVGHESIFLSILNFAILFILDDFKIINDYSQGLKKVMPSHFYRVWLFNIIMIFVVLISLYDRNYYYVLIIYLVLTIILFRYYFINFQLISLKNPI